MKIKLEKRRGGFTLIEILVVVVIIGLLAAVSVNNFRNAQDKSRVANLRSDLKSISVALETYSADQNGSYPKTGDEMKGAPGGLLQNGYMGSNKWPHSNWGLFTQKNHVDVSAPMVSAADIANGVASLPAVNVGKPIVTSPAGALAPDANSFGPKIYGTIVYEFDPPTTTWVLYGVGKDHKAATLCASKSNGGGN